MIPQKTIYEHEQENIYQGIFSRKGCVYVKRELLPWFDKYPIHEVMIDAGASPKRILELGNISDGLRLAFMEKLNKENNHE